MNQADQPARELVKKFSEELEGWYGDGEGAKACAIIAVDLALDMEKEMNELLDSEFAQTTHHPTFWEQVKQQIQGNHY